MEPAVLMRGLPPAPPSTLRAERAVFLGRTGASFRPLPRGPTLACSGPRPPQEASPTLHRPQGRAGCVPGQDGGFLPSPSKGAYVGLLGTLPLPRRLHSSCMSPKHFPYVISLFLKKMKFYNPDAGKDGQQKGKGVAEDERVGWHH